MITNETLCIATSKNGSNCRARAIRGNYCMAHAPELAGKREEARIQGGRNSAKMVRMARSGSEKFGPVYDVLWEAMQEVRSGLLDPRQAQAMASVASVMVKVFEVGEMEERLSRIER